MQHYIGLDVSMKDTAVCVVDEKGKLIEETTLPTDPVSIARYTMQLNLPIELVGLESGSMSHWLTEMLLEANLPVKCIDARHCAAFLSMQINKTDRNDARGIAEVMRCGVYREVQLKSRPIREMSALLNSRKQLVSQRRQLLLSVRGILKPLGIRLGSISKTESGLKLLCDEIHQMELQPEVLIGTNGLLQSAIAIAVSLRNLEKKVKECIENEPAAKLLMTVPGVGPITAMKYLVEIGDPRRFKNSRAVGAYIGLTPKQYASGETQKQGSISKCGCKDLRSLLVESAIVLMTRSKYWSKLKVWGLQLKGKKGLKKAATSVARKLAVIMHQMLLKNEPFRFGDEDKVKAA